MKESANPHKQQKASRLAAPTALDRRQGPARILLLQGPVGPFFSELTDCLIEHGAEVTQLTFNHADARTANKSHSIPVTCRLSDFDEHIRLHLRTDIDAVVIFGSERPAHKIAREVAEEYGIPVLSFEEGYIRPGAVSLELGGNNASSPIANVDISKIPRGFSTRMEAANYHGFWPMVWHGANYYFRREIFSGAREREFHHRSTPISSEIFFWLRNVMRKATDGGSHASQATLLMKEFPKDYYIVPLQVPSDSNIKKSANGWTTPKLIHETIRSFSKSAPKTSRLVFKIHPMSRGHSSDHKLIKNLARTHKVETRTMVLHTGSLGELAKLAAGMITINSTSGLSAIHHGIPLLTMGRSIYAHSELATLAEGEKSIDAFWNNGFVADPELRNAFLAYIRRSSLIPGDFYARRGRVKAAKHGARKILQEVTRIRRSNK